MPDIRDRKVVNIESNGKVIGTIQVPVFYPDSSIDDAVYDWVCEHFRIQWEEVEA